MISCVKKHLFGISLSTAAIAIVFGVYCFYGKAILHDYEETQICHEIDNALKECQLGENDAQDKILEKALKLYNVQQKFKDFKFMRTVHQNRYNKLNDAIRSYLISYYELPYKGKEIELADIDEYVKTVQNAIKDIDEKNKDVEKTIANLDPDIGQNLKQIDIELIKTTLNKFEELLTVKSDAETSPEKSQADISVKEPVIAAAEEGSNNEVPAANKENNDWQKGFIVKEQKKDKDGNSIKDSNGNNVYAAIEDFEFIKNKLFQICVLHEKFNELTNKNVDTAFIDNLEKCKSFKESLKYIDSQKTNEATTKKAAEILGNKISEENDIASMLKSLNSIKSLNGQYVEVIGNRIKESIKNVNIRTVQSFLKFKLHDEFVTIICDELKIRIENSYINSESFTSESFDNLKNVCQQIKGQKDNLNNHPLCDFAVQYLDWYEKLNKGPVNFQLETAEAETKFPDGIIIDKFTGFNCDFKKTDKITGIKSFKENIKDLGNNSNFNFRQPLKIRISYYLLDAKPSLKNGFFNLGFIHTTDTAEKDIYPMLKSKWELKPQLKSGNNGPYATTFTLVIKNIKNDSDYPTLEELFNNVFQKEKKSAKK